MQNRPSIRREPDLRRDGHALRRRCLGLILVLAAAAPAAAPAAGRAAGSRLGPILARVLEDPGHPAWRADGRLSVWVYFTDRDLTPPQRSAALSQAGTALPAAVARRRAKVAGPDRPLVDVQDLPLSPAYLAAATATGATPRCRSRWLDAASYEATAAQVKALAELPCVRRVDLVGKVLPPSPVAVAADARPSPPVVAAAAAWTLDYGASLPALELIHVPAVHELGYTGAGVKLALLDTGFRLTHEALVHVPVLAAYDFAAGDTIVDYQPGDAENAHVHGTQVLSTAVGFAPGHVIGPAYGASVILARADDMSITAPVEEDWWVAGLEWAEAQGADVVSSSLGFLAWYADSELDGDTAASTVAADLAAARGVLVINAAGNQGGGERDVVVAPADGDSVIAVGGTDSAGVIAPGSSSGPTWDGRIKPDVVAQGIQVTVVDAYDDSGYTTAGGTSFSTPFAAGVAALILERAPFLTPLQVREALRETANRHDDPDNHYGWGVIDALAAVYYWGPHLAHEPLRDSEDTTGPYVVAATVEDAFGLGTETPWLHYRVDGGPWQDVPLADQGGGRYAAGIPGQVIGSLVEYYLATSDSRGLEARLPQSAPTQLLSFSIWQDTQPPLLVHAPLAAQPVLSWPPAVVATVTDNLGVAGVVLTFTLNGGEVQGPYPLLRGSDDLFARPFPLEAGSLAAGDQISYTLTATDASQGANTAQSGPHDFAIVAGAGQILIADDGAGGEATIVAGWLGEAGYTTTIKTPGGTTAGELAGKQALVLLAGSNAAPLASATFRATVRSWVTGGGRLLIEGGETGFVSLISPGYATFASQVLHAISWGGDGSGSLLAVATAAGHPLLNRPSAVVPPLVLNYATEGEQDAVSPAADALLVLENAGHPGTAGALVYDDNPADPAAQVVYFPFALSALADQSQARALVVDAVALLLDRAMPAGADPEVPASRARLVDILPNPFNARAVVRIEMARAGMARLDVYDARGSLVRRLLEGGRRLDAGPHRLVWDARDERGRAVTSGVYLVRLQVEGEASAGKVMLVR